VKGRFPEMIDVLDFDTRNIFVKAALVSTLKYIYGFNYYATHNRIINYGLTIEEYPRYSRKETWANIV